MTTKFSEPWPRLLLILAAAVLIWQWSAMRPSDADEDRSVGADDLTSSVEGNSDEEIDPPAPTARSLPTPAGPSQGIVLRVYHGQEGNTLAPGAGIEVVDSWTAEVDAWDFEHQLGASRAEMFRRFASRRVADELGEVTVSIPKTGLWIRAQDGDSHSTRHFSHSEIKRARKSGLRISLTEYWPVQARVVDTNGRPVLGARVRLATKTQEGWRPSRSRLTDRNGEAHFKMALEASQAHAPERLSLAVVVADGQELRKVLTEASFNGVPIEFVIPAPSTCQVEVQFADGSSVFGGGTLRLFGVDEFAAKEKKLSRPSYVSPAPVLGGKAMLRDLTPGKTYEAEWRSRHFDRLRQRFTAPPAGQSSSFVMRLSPHLVGYSLNLVDSGGQRLRRPEVRCTIRGLIDGRERQRCCVSSEGRIFIELWRDSESSTGEVDLEIVLQDQETGLVLQGAVVTAPFPAPGTIVDLGTCRLTEPEILAAGIAQTADGSPCPGAEVRIEPAESEVPNLPRDMPTRVIADALGRWQYKAFFDPGEFLASAKARDGELGREHRFRSRSLNVPVKVGIFSAFNCTIRMESPEACEAVDIALEPMASPRPRSKSEVTINHDLAHVLFQATHLEPGAYRLRITSRFEGRLLHQVPDLVIPENGLLTHDINVKLDFDWIRLKIQDRSGRPIAGARVHCLSPKEEASGYSKWPVRTDESGEASIYTTRPHHRVRIFTNDKPGPVIASIPSDSPIVIPKSRPPLVLHSESLAALSPSFIVRLRLVEIPPKERRNYPPRVLGGRLNQGRFFIGRFDMRTVKLAASIQERGKVPRVYLPTQIIQIPESAISTTVPFDWPTEIIEQAVQELSPRK